MKPDKRMKVLYICGKRNEETPLLRRLESIGMINYRQIKLHLRSMAGPLLFKNVYLIYRTVREFKPDLLLLECAGLAFVIALPIKYLCAIPMAVRAKGNIWLEYSEIKYDIPAFEKFVKFMNFHAGMLIMRRADAILPISEHIAGVVRQYLGAEKPQYVVHIPCAKTNTPVAGVPGVAVDGKFILTITNFNFWAKVDPLVSGINKTARLQKKYGYRWNILGDGVFLEKFKKEINADGLEVVRILGHKDPKPYYKNAAALFYISGLDGLPNVLIEASYCRVPIIMNSGCPAAEFIIDGYNGLIVDFDDSARVEAVLQRLSTDSRYRTELCDNAYKYAEENFSVERVSASLDLALNGVYAKDMSRSVSNG